MPTSTMALTSALHDGRHPWSEVSTGTETTTLMIATRVFEHRTDDATVIQVGEVVSCDGYCCAYVAEYG